MSSKTLPRSLQRASGATAHWNFNPTASLSPKSHSLRSAHHPRFFCNSKLQLGFDVHTPNTHKAFSHQFSHIWVSCDHCTALATMLLKTPCQAQIPFLSSSSLSSSSPSSRFSPLPSRRYLFLQLPYARFCCPVPPYLLRWWTKESNMPFLFLFFLFITKKLGKFAMKIIENQMANFPTLLWVHKIM